MINIDHELLLRALRKHCYIPWVLLYVKGWLKAAMQTADGVLKICGSTVYLELDFEFTQGITIYIEMI